MNAQISLRLASVLVSSVFAAFAPAAPADGDAVPIYPNTHYRGDAHTPINEKAVIDSIVKGGTTSIYSGDSPETVDHWYTQMMPKCTRTTIEGAHVYRHICTTRTVNISPSQGQTSINIGPNVSP